MTVSVIMPCHNHERFLAESIEGILNQTYANLELIIIDDCSTDNSRQIIDKYKRLDHRIRFLCHTTNTGVSKSRNDGVSSAIGDYIAFCDADDVWMPEKLTLQVEHLATNSSYDIVYCDSMIIDENGLPTGERFSSVYHSSKRSGNIFGELCLTNFINTQTVVLKKQCLAPGEGFNEHIKWGEDWLFWITLARRHRFCYLDQILAKYRVHSQSTALVEPKGYRESRIMIYDKVIEKYSDIPSRTKSRMFYQIGIAHAELGQHVAARKAFLKAFLSDKSNLRAFCRVLISKSSSYLMRDTKRIDGW